MNNWCKGLRLRKGRGYALVISDNGQNHWVPGRPVKERREDIVQHQSSWRAASDGDNKTDDQQLLQTGSKDQQSQTTHLG